MVDAVLDLALDLALDLVGARRSEVGARLVQLAPQMGLFQGMSTPARGPSRVLTRTVRVSNDLQRTD